MKDIVVNHKKNMAYYASEDSIPCDCNVCKIFYDNINIRYPKIVEYLSSLGIDVLRPLKLVWIENEDMSEVEYFGCQYVVFGYCDKEYVKYIDDVKFEINETCHPDTGIKDNYFVLDFGSIYLNMK